MAGIAQRRGDVAAGLTHSLATNIKRVVADVLVRREDKDCSPQPGINLCEKPGISSSTITWIIVGTVLGLLLVATGAVLIFLHFRRKKRDKREDIEDRFQMSDYGLDELPAARKPRPDDEMKSQDGSPSGYGRRSRDPLQVGTEPKYSGGGQSNGHLNPFDDSSSTRSGNGSNHAWPKREGSQPSPLSKET